MTEKETRRSVLKTVTVGTAAVTVPSFATVVSGETDSGDVELEATATIPTDTAIDVRLYEDTNGDGDSNRSQEKSLSDGTDTYVYDGLESTSFQGDELWAEITLSQDTGGSDTPELDSMTITLPEDTGDGDGGGTTEPSTDGPGKTEEGDGPLIFRMLDRFYPFILAIILLVSGLGLGSKSMAVASLAGYLTFGYIAITTQDTLLINIFYVTLVVVFMGFAFKFWRLEGMGD